MKKQIVLLSILLSAAILSMSQEQCVSCFENTISIENYSSALGTYNSSLGLSSLAAGDSNTVSGNYAIALGKRNTASGIASFAGGYGNQASTDYSIALGYNSISNGLQSISVGSESSSLGTYSVAIGRNAHATGENAIALGKYVYSNQTSCFSFGTFLRNTGSFSVLIGMGANSSTQILENSIDYSMSIGFYSDVPTFFVGSSNGAGTTGKIGIGNVTNPLAKLHIKSDDNENATLFLQPSDWDNTYAAIELGTTENAIKAEKDSGLSFYSEKDSLFNAGNIGVGTNSPDAKLQIADGDIFIEDIDRGIIMKSPDGNCWRGTLNNTGMLEFVQVDCDDFSTGTTDHSTSRDARASIYPNPAGNQISVNLPQNYVGASLEILDISGKLLRTHPLTSTECNINISELSPGMYVFNIMDDAGKVLDSKKIVKE